MTQEAAPSVVTPPAPTPPAPTPPAPQAGAPAPSPFTPAPAAPTPPPAPEVVEVVYDPTGDAGLDLALEFIGKLGLGPEHPAIQAATKGDWAQIEATFKGLGDKAKGYERYLAIAKDSHQRGAEAATKAEKETDAKLTAVFGSKEEWAKVKAWVAEKADPDEVKDIHAAFKAGGKQAIAMAVYLKETHRKATGYAPSKSVSKDGADRSNQTNTTGALDPRAYGKAVEKLAGSLRGRPLNESPEYADLQRRRRMWTPPGK